jgi:hypothetical protein
MMFAAAVVKMNMGLPLNGLLEVHFLHCYLAMIATNVFLVSVYAKGIAGTRMCYCKHIPGNNCMRFTSTSV